MSGPRSAPAWAFLFPGAVFGVLLTRGELISWYRIQEMFRFQGFHMYGVILSAVAVAWLAQRALAALGRPAARVTLPEEEHSLRPGPAQAIGGVIFGLGWGLTGVCPGPIFALIGNGVVTAWLVLLGALAGTWCYSMLRKRLPH